MKKGLVIGMIIGVIVIVIAVAGFMFLGRGETEQTTWTPIEVNQGNVANVMTQSSFVQDIPKEGVIALYVGEKGYTLTRGKMEAGIPGSPDVTVTMPESYLDVLGQSGWCVAMQQAYHNQDVGIEMHGSTASLAWKYRALEKYRLCLG